MERRLSVSTFWLIPSRSFRSSLNRHGLCNRFLIISNFHLLPIKATLVATCHSGNSSFVSTLSAPYIRFFLRVTSDYNVISQILSIGYRLPRLLFFDYVIKKCVLFLHLQTLSGRGLQTAEKHDIYTNAGGHRKLCGKSSGKKINVFREEDERIYRKLLSASFYNSMGSEVHRHRTRQADWQYRRINSQEYRTVRLLRQYA